MYLYAIKEANKYLETNLEQLLVAGQENELANQQFAQFLLQLDPDLVDQKVHALNSEIAPKIDCTSCGNCCKTLLININEKEADALSEHLDQTREIFDKNYLEKGMNGTLLINAVPCHFLQENKCTVYDYRFEGCKEFPAMHLPHFNKRLFTTFMHYNRCPIIFNIVEQLKIETQFVMETKNEPL
jgi:Fe-S-cluster containining protein